MRAAEQEKAAAAQALKLQELYEYCRLGDVDLAPEEYIANRLTPAERNRFEKDGYIIVVSSLETS